MRGQRVQASGRATLSLREPAGLGGQGSILGKGSGKGAGQGQGPNRGQWREECGDALGAQGGQRDVGPGPKQGAQARHLEEGPCKRKAGKGPGRRHQYRAVQASQGEQGGGPGKGPAVKAQGRTEPQGPAEAQARSQAREGRARGEWPGRGGAGRGWAGGGLRTVDRAGEGRVGGLVPAGGGRLEAQVYCQV